MGHTILQTARIVMMAFWSTFILVALNMALGAWTAAPNWMTAAFFVIAAYAGFGMLLGLAARFHAAREYLRRGY